MDFRLLSILNSRINLKNELWFIWAKFVYFSNFRIEKSYTWFLISFFVYHTIKIQILILSSTTYNKKIRRKMLFEIKIYVKVVGLLIKNLVP